jgi:hypothetical protein
VKNSALRPSTLALLALLFSIGIAQPTIPQARAARTLTHTTAASSDPTGTDPEPPPGCCNVIAVH